MKKLCVYATVTLLAATCLFAKGKGKAADGGKQPKKALPAEVVKKYDKNGDGKLDKQERIAMRQERQANARRLKKYDKDGDGKLSEGERAEMRKAFQAARLKKYDKDGDGKLSEEERAAMRKDLDAKKKASGEGAPACKKPCPKGKPCPACKQGKKGKCKRCRGKKGQGRPAPAPAPVNG